MRFAYLISCYPAANHTFVLREIMGLRNLGFELFTASISAPDRATDAMTEVEREEQERTSYVKNLGHFFAVKENLAELLVRPRRYLSGLIYALRLSNWQPRRIISYLMYFVEAVIVGRWMRRNQLSLLHTHFSSSVALIARKIFPIEISMTIHGSGEFNEPACFNLEEKVNAASLIIAISNYGKSQLMKVSEPANWDKIEVVRLGIEPSVFTPVVPKPELDVFEVLCVGQLVPVKGHELLIDATAEIVRRGGKIRLRLVGDGRLRKMLEEKVHVAGLQDCVVFEGWRNQTEVIELYRTANAFALASFAEGIPVVLMEAMSMGVPCVATRITGVPELITDGIDGLLVSPGSSEELADALLKLMNDSRLRESLATAARTSVLSKYNLSKNIGQLAEVFKNRFLEIDAGRGRSINQSPASHGRSETGGLAM